MTQPGEQSAAAAGQPGEWFFALDDQQRGPVGIEDIRYMILSGTLSSASLVWTTGMPQWSAAATVPELADVFNTVGSAPRNLSYGLTDKHYVLAAGIEYGTFWQRLGALFIDSIALQIVTQPIVLIINYVVNEGMNVRGAQQALVGFNIAFGQCAGWLYYALMESSSKQATLGKMALGLVVTDMEGRPITFGRATGRYFGKIISGIICSIGYLMMLWNDQRQTLHDQMAKTLVIKRR